MGTKFIKAKKTSEPYYSIPKNLASKIGLLHISESGICYLGKNIYSKAFIVNETSKKKANGNEKINGCMMVLRGYDVPFKYIEYANGTAILDINVIAKDFEESKMILEHLEDDMKSSLHTFDILIEAMQMQDRLQFLHQKFMNEVKDARIDINNYIENTTWFTDIDYKKFQEKDIFLNTELECKSYCYVRRMPTENISTLYEIIHQHKGITDMMIEYEPISEPDIHKKIQELYDDVLETNFSSENERNYVMTGIYFTLVGSEESIEQEFQQLKKEVYSYNCRITPFYFNQLNVFKAFNDFSTEKVKQLRLVQVSKAVKVTPLNEELKKVSEESSILDVFDSLRNING